MLRRRTESLSHNFQASGRLPRGRLFSWWFWYQRPGYTRSPEPHLTWKEDPEIGKYCTFQKTYAYYIEKEKAPIWYPVFCWIREEGGRKGKKEEKKKRVDWILEKNRTNSVWSWNQMEKIGTGKDFFFFGTGNIYIQRDLGCFFVVVFLLGLSLDLSYLQCKWKRV